MAKNCFDTAPFESLDSCPNDEVNGGVTTRVFYAPAAFLEKCILPPNTGELGKANTIEEANLALKQGSTWKGIDLQINENELKMSLVGNAGNKKAKVLDFIGRYKNVPMIFIVPDAVGTLWVVGTKINPAFMDSAEATTGKKAEDDAGVILKITANTKLYKYAGTITEG